MPARNSELHEPGRRGIILLGNAVEMLDELARTLAQVSAQQPYPNQIEDIRQLASTIRDTVDLIRRLWSEG